MYFLVLPVYFLSVSWLLVRNSPKKVRKMAEFVQIFIPFENCLSTVRYHRQVVLYSTLRTRLLQFYDVQYVSSTTVVLVYGTVVHCTRTVPYSK